MLRRSTLAAPLLLAAMLCARSARAQSSSTTTTTTTQPTCMNSLFTANLGLRIGDKSVNLNYLNYVFNRAECECENSDVKMTVQPTTAFTAAVKGASNQLLSYVGTDCTNLLNRTGQEGALCESFDSGFDYPSFVGSSGLIQVAIPTGPLFSPNAERSCDARTNANGVWLLFAIGGSTSTLESCELPLSENTLVPQAPDTLTATGGDGAVNLTWDEPPTTSTGEQVPYRYQVLCADSNGQPVTPAKNVDTQSYSTCINGQIFRRNDIFGGSTISLGASDAGVTTDAGTTQSLTEPSTLDRQSSLDTEADPLDGGTATDGGSTVVTNTDWWRGFDPKFLCSEPITGGLGTTASIRITGLTNGVPYQFLVLAIDRSGNAIASAPVIATPQPTDNLYTRFRRDGGGPGGFCFIATAAWGSYESRYVQVLRDFRDEWLLPTETGRAFVDWYYASSPAAAQVISEHRSLRVLTQMVLWPVIAAAAFVVYLTAWQKALVLALVLAWLYRRRIQDRILRAPRNA